MLEIQNICKTYSNGRGILNFNLQISEPSITAIIGPNGAGKSTLFNIINGLITQYSGNCTLNGERINKTNFKYTGFLPEENFLIENFSVIQMIDYIICIKEIKVDNKTIKYLLDGFSLMDYKNVKIKKLSQGMKKRVSIICAIIGEPRLIILDEPLNALDIQSVIFLKNILKQMKHKGSYILISSHILDFLDDIVDKIVFLKDGNVLKVHNYDGTKTESLYREIYNVE